MGQRGGSLKRERPKSSVVKEGVAVNHHYWVPHGACFDGGGDGVPQANRSEPDVYWLCNNLHMNAL